jgi:hypothetical protein
VKECYWAKYQAMTSVASILTVTAIGKPNTRMLITTMVLTAAIENMPPLSNVEPVEPRDRRGVLLAPPST